MTQRFLALGVLALVGAAHASSDISATNAWKVEERIFNDNPFSTLNVTNNFPGVLQFDESYPAGVPGGFANKHVGWLSNDGGASRLGLTPAQSWTITFDVSIQAPFGTPRKEAGIEVRNPRPALGYVDEGQVLIASDGEVAVFGAVMPFHGFGNIYTLGTTASVSWTYFAPGVLGPQAAYQLVFVDAVTGAHDSGPKFWGIEPDGTNGFNLGTGIGLKAQNARLPVIDDSSIITYSNFTAVPTPGALALLGMGMLAGARRRR